MGIVYWAHSLDLELNHLVYLVCLLLQLRGMVKCLLRAFYRFCDHLDELMLVYCEYDRHKARTKAYHQTLKAQLTPIPLFGGPHDGDQMQYAGLVIRFALYPEGAYFFDGERYKWTEQAIPCE
jgi:hypothetical protein